MLAVFKRVVVGRPLGSDAVGHATLPKRLALPIFCSDPLSSVAYATQEILLVLAIGGAAALTLTPWVGLAVVFLLVVVVASYSKTLYAYPGGGGAYAVSKANLGQTPALVAAAALVVDYILTVSVSVTSGIANLVSAFPALAPHTMAICLAVVVVLTAINLRGIRESGRVFAAPTYAFIGTVLIMLVLGFAMELFGDGVTAQSADYPVHGHDLTNAALIFLVLRAFASGCTALTGVEAISNGVPFFRRPRSRNAAITLVVMGALAVTMFYGVTLLATASGVKYAEDPTELGLPADFVQQTVIAQLGTAVFGAGSFGFYVLQIATMLVLVLAANTAYNAFPQMASVLGRDGFLPRQLGRRGDRLAFSNGIILLAAFAGALIVMFDASVTRLIQLYILGVFLSFSLSQFGMVRHWTRQLRDPNADRGGVQASRAVNLVGALVTSLVLVIVITTKFSHGAWIVMVAIPLFVALMLGIKRHYDHTDARLSAPDGGVRLPSRVHAVVLVSKLNAPSLQALAYARATRPSSLVGLHVELDGQGTKELKQQWLARGIPVPLVTVDSPFRDVTGPVIEYVKGIARQSERDIVTVFIPEYVVRRWWEHILHNQSALRLKTRL
ncbi:MAG: APC family permease, partial [Candidatus Nanopelagicales bacterium]